MPDRPIRIRVTRSGGFAGIATHGEVDTSTLPTDQANEVAELLSRVDMAALRASSTAHPPGQGRGADRFQYDITVQQGDQHYSMSLPESAVPPELKPLLTRVLRGAQPE